MFLDSDADEEREVAFMTYGFWLVDSMGVTERTLLKFLTVAINDVCAMPQASFPELTNILT